MKNFKAKIQSTLQMFEVIYTHKNELNIGVIRLWSLKKMKDRVLGYLPLADLPNPEKYVTKKIIRDVDYVYDTYSAILSQMK